LRQRSFPPSPVTCSATTPRDPKNDLTVASSDQVDLVAVGLHLIRGLLGLKLDRELDRFGDNEPFRFEGDGDE
jgi:hypothetical protein